MFQKPKILIHKLLIVANPIFYSFLEKNTSFPILGMKMYPTIISSIKNKSRFQVFILQTYALLATFQGSGFEARQNHNLRKISGVTNIFLKSIFVCTAKCYKRKIELRSICHLVKKWREIKFCWLSFLWPSQVLMRFQ